MKEGTPSGSEYNKPMAVVLKGPTAELYLFLRLDIRRLYTVGRSQWPRDLRRKYAAARFAGIAGSMDVSFLLVLCIFR
jgi:hypothetical protein